MQPSEAVTQGETNVRSKYYRRTCVVIAALLLLAVSLVGIAGLRLCPPRPAAQESWAIVAIAPIVVLATVAAFGVTR